jgi:hypothetical protein
MDNRRNHFDCTAGSLPADHCADAHTPTRHSPERDLSRPRHAGYMPD